MARRLRRVQRVRRVARVQPLAQDRDRQFGARRRPRRASQRAPVEKLKDRADRALVEERGEVVLLTLPLRRSPST